MCWREVPEISDRYRSAPLFNMEDELLGEQDGLEIRTDGNVLGLGPTSSTFDFFEFLIFICIKTYTYGKFN